MASFDQRSKFSFVYIVSPHWDTDRAREIPCYRFHMNLLRTISEVFLGNLMYVYIYTERENNPTLFSIVLLFMCSKWWIQFSDSWFFNTLRPRQNGRLFADDTFIRIFLIENVWISIKISLKFVPKGPINNIPALVQIMAWRRLGDKPLSETMLASLLTHICVTRPQWVNETELISTRPRNDSWIYHPVSYCDFWIQWRSYARTW